ncbi:bromodomain-containing protein [Rhizophagus clarus]|uniref:Bromodomain-containing protein n=1 Tax=Rhizophagus clarus TaxID=94130 RepID=A0A8H3LGL4_9GLOM|nr:bromodomain-containing protein [Rhizophagus clarus]
MIGVTLNTPRGHLITTEHLQQRKNLQIFWEEIINKYKEESLSEEVLEEENLVPASFLKDALDQQKENITFFSKETPEKQPDTLVKEKENIKLINFCYDILHKLENNPYTDLFYKVNEKDIINKVIKYPMDLFTINLKLENNQYTNLEEFEKDIRLVFRNCYTYNDVKSEIYCSGEALESIFNKKWNEKLIFQTRKKGELKRTRDNDADTFTRSQKKQNKILEENKNHDLIYKQNINNTFPITLAYENLVIGNIIPFIKLLKTFLSTRSQMSLSSADESMLQVTVESLLPLKYRTGDNYIGLELKYISLVGLVKNQNTKYGANKLENLDKILEKENEEFLLKRPYSYWSKEYKRTNQTTIGYVILVIGFRRILWKPVEEVVSDYTYNKV